MRDISPFEHHRFRCDLVQIRRVNFHPSIASKRIRALLVGKEQNQIRLSVGGHEYKCALNQRSSRTATLRLGSARASRAHFGALAEMRQRPPGYWESSDKQSDATSGTSCD